MQRMRWRGGGSLNCRSTDCHSSTADRDGLGRELEVAQPVAVALLLGGGKNATGLGAKRRSRDLGRNAGDRPAAGSSARRAFRVIGRTPSILAKCARDAHQADFGGSPRQRSPVDERWYSRSTALICRSPRNVSARALTRGAPRAPAATRCPRTWSPKMRHSSDSVRPAPPT